MGLSKGFEVLSNHLTDRYTELKLCPALQKTLNCFINHKVIVYDTLLSERARLLNFESTQREDIYEKNHDIEKNLKQQTNFSNRFPYIQISKIIQHFSIEEDKRRRSA